MPRAAESEATALQTAIAALLPFRPLAALRDALCALAATEGVAVPTPSPAPPRRTGVGAKRHSSARRAAAISDWPALRDQLNVELRSRGLTRRDLAAATKMRATRLRCLAPAAKAPGPATRGKLQAWLARPPAADRRQSASHVAEEEAGQAPAETFRRGRNGAGSSGAAGAPAER